MLSDLEIADSAVIERVDCPACHQRREHAIDCHCCGGIGAVDVDCVRSVVQEALSDVVSNYRGVTNAPAWLHPGYYALDKTDGSPVFYIVLNDRTVHCVDEDRLDSVWQATHPRTSIFVRLLSWVGRKLPRLRGAA